MAQLTESKPEGATTTESGDKRAALATLIAALGNGDVDAVLDAAAILSAGSHSSQVRSGLLEELNTIKETLDTLAHLRSPSSLSMTSTNLPDSLEKLSQVLSMSSETTHSILSILDQQELLLDHSERLVRSLEDSNRGGRITSEQVTSFVNDVSLVHKESRTLLSRLLSAQEYQDLCGQSIAKVLRMNEGLDAAVAQLLGSFQAQTEPVQPLSKAETVKQDEADSLLKEFGL